MYATPESVNDPSTCSFYHCMDIPGHGEVGNQWELRAVADEYLGHTDFRGKRVLDVGAASGFLTFEMERRGAEVVSFDMVDGSGWNVVPQADIQGDMDKYYQQCIDSHRQLKNAYWFTHERTQSKAKVFYGDVYNLPVELGQFDIVFFGMILGHLRDPFQALWSGSRLSKGNVIVTNQSTHNKWWRNLGKKRARARFMPSPKNGFKHAWWDLSDECVSQMLEVLGFETEQRFSSYPQCVVEHRNQKERCRTTVTKRVAGHVLGLANPSEGNVPIARAA